ncbi:MAG: hypothetical protein AAGH60_11185 [Pseudomonadota bacterium]
MDLLRKPAFAAVTAGVILGAFFYSFSLGPPQGMGFDRAADRAAMTPSGLERLLDLGLSHEF